MKITYYVHFTYFHTFDFVFFQLQKDPVSLPKASLTVSNAFNDDDDVSFLNLKIVTYALNYLYILIISILVVCSFMIIIRTKL